VVTRILIFGKNGQVATELARAEWPADIEATQLGRAECDLRRPGAASEAISAASPDIVINAAAYTAVDLAETEQDAARALNAEAPRDMARATAERGAALIHISTDYVFDGEGQLPHVESDACRPLSIYGSTKHAGEMAIRELQPRHVILRTSWVFGAHGANFARTMLRLAKTRDEVAIVGDQIGGPTPASDMANAITRIALGLTDGAASFGTYHYAGAPDTSWYRFARAIFGRAKERGLRVPSIVREIASAEYPTAARRPLNSRLDCGAILRDWGIDRPSWETALDRSFETLTRDVQGG
jgi:dTDP-4-dehydrorhamnose reductase